MKKVAVGGSIRVKHSDHHNVRTEIDCWKWVFLECNIIAFCQRLASISNTEAAASCFWDGQCLQSLFLQVQQRRKPDNPIGRYAPAASPSMPAPRHDPVPSSGVFLKTWSWCGPFFRRPCPPSWCWYRQCKTTAWYWSPKMFVRLLSVGMKMNAM